MRSRRRKASTPDRLLAVDRSGWDGGSEGWVLRLVALAVTGYRLEWFFPAAMVIVGAHYLPFVFLYGMRHYAVLAAILACGGVGLALWGPESFSLGAWITGLVLLTFAFRLRASVATESATNAQGVHPRPEPLPLVGQQVASVGGAKPVSR